MQLNSTAIRALKWFDREGFENAEDFFVAS